MKYPKKRKSNLKKYISVFSFILLLYALYYGYTEWQFSGHSLGSVFGQGTAASAQESSVNIEVQTGPNGQSLSIVDSDPSAIPDFNGKDYVILNGNKPNFTEADIDAIRGEHYGALDRLGRCQTAYARIDSSMMPNEERESISQIYPSGWENDYYPDLIEDGWLYNRSHLIAYGLTGQNANERNLITGTTYMNMQSMLPFELAAMDCLEGTYGRKHILYRVSPYFKGKELVARGVEMEAFSVEDRGRSLSYHVFVYNYQPGIEINYKTGASRRRK